MELITKSQLDAVRNNFEKANRPGALYEAVNLRSLRDSVSSDVTIFLSHKHDQRKELMDAIALLKTAGVNVYVDWLDEGMPKVTSGVTAAKIKTKIRSCQKFIFLATEQAIASKWCNWELGLGDAAKYIKDIALLVVKDDYGTFSGSEYMQIYPVIGLKYSFNLSGYEVEFPDKTKVDLVRWLNS
jgi:hypothetical protein